MPDKLVEIPGVGTIAFPETMSDADIEAASAKLYREKQGAFSMTGTARPSATDTALGLLPSAGGALGGVLGGLGGTAFGFGFGGIPGAAGGAALGGAAGESVKELIDAFRGKAVAASPLDAAKQIGTEGAIQGAMEAGGGLAMKGLGAGARAVYRGYLKPSLAASQVGKADQIVKTALEEALPITKSGSAHAGQVIGELRAEVDRILANTSGDIDLKAVADRVRAFAKRKYYRPGRALEDYESALKVADRIDAHPSLDLPPPALPKTTASASEANVIKRDLQQGVGPSQYGVPSRAAKDAEKMGAREMRLEIEKLAPEVAPRNARESKLIDAARAIERAVAREGNQSAVVGVKTLAGGALGAEEYKRTGDPYMSAATALGARLLLTPAAASRAAIVASRLGKVSGGVPANIARAAVAAVMSSQQAEPPAQGVQ